MRYLALVLLFVQDPTNGPVRVKQALSAARSAAASWDAGAYFGGLAVQPANEKIFDTGRAEGWTFQFYTRRKCPPGKVRMIGIQVGPKDTRYPVQKEINGLAVNTVQESEIDAPFPVKVDDDWLDSDRAFAAFKKAGFEKATSVKLFEIKWVHGKTLWRGVHTLDKAFFIDGSGKTLPEKEDVEKTILALYSKPDSFEQIETSLRNDVAGWKDAGEPRIVLFTGRALGATEFLSDPRVHAATIEFYLEKPKLKRFAVRVVNDRVEWFKPCLEDEPKKEDFEKQTVRTFKKFDAKKLKEALDGNAKLKAWLAKYPKNPVVVRTLETDKLLLTFESDEELTLRYDVTKQSLE